MSLSWTSLRAWGGSQQTAFEELCCQLARSEKPPNARFIRKGSPDAGVECFASLPNGDEWGWQAKFFETSLTATQWNQVDRSVKRALDSHPKLTRYFVCVPRVRPDGRGARITTEMQKWDERVAKWSDWAVDRDMEVEFVWWGSSELWERLSRSEHAGRLAFWFGNPDLFADSWFKERLAEAVASAETRYSPQLHVDLPIAKKFELFGRTSAAAGSVRRLAKDIRRACSYEIRRVTPDEFSAGSPSRKSVVDACNQIVNACDEIVDALSDCQSPPHQKWNIADIREAIETALGLIDNSREAIASAARDYEESNPKGETGHVGSSNPFRSATSALRYLEGQLWATQSELRAVEPIINSDLLIVTGEAGTGKTHLLCDVAENRIRQGLPTVIVMGQRFLSAEAPWGQALAQLDLANSSADEFIGALEAAAQAADSRALFIIDAINEGEGAAIWPAHLSPLLEQLRRSPWIATVLSVRTPYLERVVPPEVHQAAHVLEHQGFAESTYTAVRRYCEQFDLEFPTTPLLRPEFDNPLFLKTMCEGLHSTGQRRFPVGSEGITRVFDRYLDGINASVAGLLDLDPQARTVNRALAQLATSLSERGTRWLPRGEAQSLVDEFAPASGYSRTLYRALVNSGLLMEVLPSGPDSEPAIQVGFEWFADHLIAKYLVDSHEDPESLTRELVRSDGDGVAAWQPLTAGLLDALAILLPERHHVELPDASPDGPSVWSVRQSFLKTLPWRDPDTIGSRCHELVDDAFDNLDEHEWPGLVDSLVTCATIPGHPIGAKSLDDRLRQLPMPDRDADWSTYLHYAYGEDGPVDRLLDWAESLSATNADIDPESVRACSVVLAWFLTASNRFVRDRATKCLVALLHENFNLAAELVLRFRDVDDPYVYERVMAAAYGIAMRSTDPQGMAVLAEAVYREVFADGDPPVHYLLRDYARGVIDRALYIGAAIEVDHSKIEPPYQSDWPHIPDEAELEELDSDEADSSESASDMGRVRGQIRFSVMNWDFARYIIGTNSSSESSSWLSVPVRGPRWRSCDEQLEEFLDSLDADLRELFERLIERNRPRPPRIGFAARSAASDEGESVEPGFAFAIREPFAGLELEQVVTPMLNSEQKTRYDELMALRDPGEPRLGLDVIQRYVLWRAFDLGWSIERFGYFDRYLSGRARHDTKKAERMGKKYQWIAYHEILAYISDHFQYRDRYADDGPSDLYEGPWQSYERDIDPSALEVRESTSHSKKVPPQQWWYREFEIPESEQVDNIGWVKRRDDIPNRDQQLYFKNDSDDTNWVKLHGMDVWKLSPPYGREDHEVDYRELWLEANGYFIPSENVSTFLEWTQEVDFMGRWMPEPPGDGRLYFGELGWSRAFNSILGSQIGPHFPEPSSDDRACPVPLSVEAYSYTAEISGYDCSHPQQTSLLRPSLCMADALNLRWTGLGANFVDENEDLVMFDPSIYGHELGALMVREDRLQQFLNRRDAALVWAIVGEKRVRAPGDWMSTRSAFLRITGAYVYGEDALNGHISTQLEVVDRR